MIYNDLPLSIYSGIWQNGHCQGIAADLKSGCVYFSFTTALVKTDMSGNVLGSVTGLLGHLGCIAFNEADGMVYGSLEYKNDEIGRGILRQRNSDAKLQNAFYVAVFDAKNIVRTGMDACADGVMRTVYLREVVKDYLAAFTAPDGRELTHRYGCSGIDGITFGPLFGAAYDSKRYLYVAYGVYGDVSRRDNDHQVLLCYDVSDWSRYLRSLSQDSMHTDGPEAPYQKLFAPTGNTRYGIQNLEYDTYTGNWLAAVYTGEKPCYPNFPLYIFDGSKAPVFAPLYGLNGESGLTLTLLADGLHDDASGVYGWSFPYGQTGLCSLGDGRFYVSHDERTDDGWNSTIRLYRWDGASPLIPVTTA